MNGDTLRLPGFNQSQCVVVAEKTKTQLLTKVRIAPLEVTNEGNHKKEEMKVLK